MSPHRRPTDPLIPPELRGADILPSTGADPRDYNGQVGTAADDPYGRHDAAIGARDILLVSEAYAEPIQTAAAGQMNPGPQLLLTLVGESTQTADPARLQVLCGEDGAAAVVTEIMALLARADHATAESPGLYGPVYRAVAAALPNRPGRARGGPVPPGGRLTAYTAEAFLLLDHLNVTLMEREPPIVVLGLGGRINHTDHFVQAVGGLPVDSVAAALVASCHDAGRRLPRYPGALRARLRELKRAGVYPRPVPPGGLW